MRNTTCCIIGSGPSTYPWGHDELWPDCIRLKLLLNVAMERMHRNGVTRFYTGMALGAELWAAERIVERNQIGRDKRIGVFAVIPFEGQADRWSQNYRERYFDTLASVDGEITLRAHYAKGCVQECNRYMIEHSAYLIAVLGAAQKGGTRAAVNDARIKGLEIVTIDPTNLSLSSLHPDQAAVGKSAGGN